MKEKNKRMVIIAGIIIGAIMILSPFAAMFYGFNDQTARRTYRGYVFTRQQYGYQAKIDGKTEDFFYFPGDIEQINVSNSTIDLVKGKGYIIFTSDMHDTLNETIATLEYNSDKMLRDLGKTQMSFGYTNQFTGRPTITCANATAGMPIIYVKKGNETSISNEGNCVVIQARQQDEMLAAYERVLDIMVGVMDK